jgi:hypothetical protein
MSGVELVAGFLRLINVHNTFGTIISSPTIVAAAGTMVAIAMITASVAAF